MKTIVFIVPQLSQPRCIKRISSIANAGIPVKVYGFDNNLYRNNIETASFEIEEIIPRIKDTSRISKVIFFFKIIRRILKKNKNCLFYFFGYEIGVFGFLLKCRNYIYEEADVSAARIRNKFVRKMMLSLDRNIISHSKNTIFTSGGFPDYIFKKNKPENIILLPNKLSSWFKQNDIIIHRKINYHHIKFGFIGLIRYPDTIIRFAKVIGRNFSQHEFHFYGDVERKEYIDKEVNSYNNVFFHGPFVNPYDLINIYSEIDINIVCYDTSSGNVNIAEPNKLYESIYFNTPIVVSKNTYLAKRVNELGVGTSIDASNDNDIIAYINSLYDGYYDNVIRNIQNIEKSTLIDTSDILISNIKKYL